MADENATSGDCLKLVGRAPGLTSWLLRRMGLDPTTLLAVSDKEVTFRRSGLFGQTQCMVPLSCVASTLCDYRKPLWMAVTGVWLGLLLVVLLMEMGMGLPISLLGGGHVMVAFLAVYGFSKTIAIGVVTTGGLVLGFTFKPSVIENVRIDMVAAREAIKILNARVLEAQSVSVTEEFV